MRLDYSPIHAGFAYKTTEQLRHSRVLLRGIVCSHDDAVLVHPELLVPVRCCGSWAKLCATPVAQAGAAIRADCVYRSGSVWAMNVHGYRSSGAALCCALSHQHCWGHPLPIVATCALVVAEPCAWAGARRVARCTTCLRFQLRDQSAPSCAHCCERMRVRCARRAKRCRLSRGRAISNWHSHSVHCSSLVPTAWRNCSRSVMYVASA